MPYLLRPRRGQERPRGRKAGPLVPVAQLRTGPQGRIRPVPDDLPYSEADLRRDPHAIRDKRAGGLQFAVKTRDAAVAGLGETIRDYPSVCPTGLIERPTYIGVATATLPGSGSQPFVRLRVPEITEQAADQRARETEQYRRDPSAVVAPVQTIERKAS